MQFWGKVKLGWNVLIKEARGAGLLFKDRVLDEFY